MIMLQNFQMVIPYEQLAILENEKIQSKLKKIWNGLDERIKESRYASIISEEISEANFKEVFFKEFCIQLLVKANYLALTSPKDNNVNLIFRRLLTSEEIEKALNGELLVEILRQINSQNTKKKVSIWLIGIKDIEVKIRVIKAIYSGKYVWEGKNSIDLKQAKDLVDKISDGPVLILKDVRRKYALSISNSIADAGGIVIMK